MKKFLVSLVLLSLFTLGTINAATVATVEVNKTYKFITSISGGSPQEIIGTYAATEMINNILFYHVIIQTTVKKAVPDTKNYTDEVIEYSVWLMVSSTPIIVEIK